jgi:Zn-dependent oligopeptidase
LSDIAENAAFFSYQLQAAFDVAHKLFGVVFEIRTGVPVYHPDVRAYEVKDADGFEAFKQRGLFDPDLALSYRKNILEAGGSEPPMELYKRFRGAEPSIEPLLARRGLDTTG